MGFNNYVEFMTLRLLLKYAWDRSVSQVQFFGGSSLLMILMKISGQLHQIIYNPKDKNFMWPRHPLHKVVYSYLQEDEWGSWLTIQRGENNYKGLYGFGGY